MEPTEIQCERIARYLDGENVQLTQDELLLAGVMKADQETVGAMLDASAPPEVMRRLQRLVADQPARRARVIRFHHFSAAAAAVAAVLIIGAGLFLAFRGEQPAPTVQPTPNNVATQQPSSEIMALTRQLEELQSGIISQTSSFTDEMDQLSASLCTLWLTDDADLDI